MAFRSSRTRTVLLGAILLLALGYMSRLGDGKQLETVGATKTATGAVAIFGASGTAGDGILKAALADPDVRKIYVVTRHTTPRIDSGVAAGRVVVKIHTDFRDYTPIGDVLRDADAVYWALGTSALKVSDAEYGTIHVDYPVEFVQAWLAARPQGEAVREMSFHLVSGQGAGAEARAHWAKEKARAEDALFKLAAGTHLRVVSFRPGYIAPAEERANVLHKLAYEILAPIRFAIRSTTIGEAMLEATARRSVANGTILEMDDILALADAYRARRDALAGGSEQ